jgi:hypothetical protein
MTAIGDVFKPGDKVPNSGIYRVIHDNYHTEEHEVTCVYGKQFPPCNHCGHHPRFTLVQYAQHVDQNEYFKPMSLAQRVALAQRSRL